MPRLGFVSFTALLLASGCAVGPDFKRPIAPPARGYVEGDLPKQTAAAEGLGGGAQTFATDTDLPADWWKWFGSDPLNRLMDEALKNNPDLEAAQASLRQAREIVAADRGLLLPEVDGNLSTTREKIPLAAYGLPGAGSSLFTLYNANVSVSYGLDIFGLSRRTIEAAEAQAEEQQFQLRATYVTLTTNLVTAAIQEASLREQIKQTQSIIALESKEREVLQSQFELGGSPKTTVLEQEAILAQTQATLPALQKQLAQKRHQLSVLAGRLPDNAPEETFTLAELHLPEALPVSLPAKLVDQRPDIRSAEAMLHQASAGIGVAAANMLPQISITGNYGTESVSFSTLSTPATTAWSIGGSLLQPIFRGGELLHQKRAAVAAYDKAAAQYRSAVLTAFANVADTLRALQYDADALATQVTAARVASNSLDLAHNQFQSGAITYPQLLDTERTYQQTQIALVQAQAARFADTAALFQALGGGWWSKEQAAVATPSVKDDSVPVPSVTSAPPEKTPASPAPKENAAGVPLPTLIALPPEPSAPAATPASPSPSTEKKP